MNDRIRKIIHGNFYPVLTWHPRWPRKKGEELERPLWTETNKWNGGVILWLVSPDKKIREPIPYFDREKGVTSAKELEKKFRSLAKKHGFVFVEPGKGGK